MTTYVSYIITTIIITMTVLITEAVYTETNSGLVIQTAPRIAKSKCLT